MAVAALGLPTLLSIASVGLGIAGVVASTSATIAANNYQKQVAARNAEIMNLNASRAIQASQQAQLQQDQQTAALLGEQLALQSASGLKIGGKSQMLTRKSARELGRLDALSIRNAGDVEAFNFQMAAQDEYDKIKFLDSSSSSALLSGFLDAASIGITGLRSLPPTQLSSIFGATKRPAAIGAQSYQGTGLSFKPSVKFAR